MSRLFDFAFTDRRYRFKAYFVSGVLALLFALILHLGLGWDERNSILMMVIIFCFVTTAFIFSYVAMRASSGQGLAAPMGPRLGYAVLFLAIVIAGLLSISADTRIIHQVQASIIDSRIAGLTGPSVTNASYFQSSEKAQAQLRARFQKLQSIADISYIYQIPVDPNSLLKAQNMIQASLKPRALSEETRQAGLIASAKLVGVATLGKTDANTKQLQSYPINSAYLISNQNVRFQGSHSLLSGNGDFVISHSAVVFDGIDFRREKPFGQTFFGLGSDSTVVVHNSTIENIFQTLDGITWIGVRFQHSMIKVDGGPFALVNVSFNDCDLRWLDLNPAGFDLKERINKANGEPISFVYEGNQVLTIK